ncbi:MAG: TlpA family protein disulfide reductase [Opitutaceae bacterium]|nr:TlpA family protein disulfide reductase [Opitutaceae bacterium]
MKSPDLHLPRAVEPRMDTDGHGFWHRLCLSGRLMMRTFRGALPVLASGLLFVASTGTDLEAALKEGDPLPKLSDYSFEGTLPADLAGKVIVLDFWASWCAPCKASFPALGAIQRELGSSGLTVLGVSVDEKKAAYEAFLKKQAPPFATVRDADHRFVKVVQAPKMPTTYLIDRKGVVRHVHEGFHGEGSVKMLREQLTALLNEKP